MIPKGEIIVSKHSWTYLAKVGLGLVTSIYASFYWWRLATTPASFDLRYTALFICSAYWVLVLVRMLLRHQVIRVGEQRLLIQRPIGITKIDQKDYGIYWEEPPKVDWPWNSLAWNPNRIYFQSTYGKSFVLSEGVYKNYWEVRNSIVSQFQEGTKDHFKGIRYQQEHGYLWLLVLISLFVIWGLFSRFANPFSRIEQELPTMETSLEDVETRLGTVKTPSLSFDSAPSSLFHQSNPS